MRKWEQGCIPIFWQIQGLSKPWPFAVLAACILILTKIQLNTRAP